MKRSQVFIFGLLLMIASACAPVRNTSAQNQQASQNTTSTTALTEVIDARDNFSVKMKDFTQYIQRYSKDINDINIAILSESTTKSNFFEGRKIANALVGRIAIITSNLQETTNKDALVSLVETKIRPYLNDLRYVIDTGIGILPELEKKDSTVHGALLTYLYLITVEYRRLQDNVEEFDFRLRRV
jgi:hypothetical protein